MNSVHKRSYKIYKSLVNLLRFHFYGYEFSSIIAKDISFFAYKRLDIKALPFISIRIKFNLYYSLKYLEQYRTEEKILFSSVTSRPNYLLLINNVRQKLTTPSICIQHTGTDEFVHGGKNRLISLLFFVPFLTITGNAKAALYLCSIMCYHLNTIEQAEKLYAKRKFALLKLVTFDCTYGEDSLLTSFFKKRDIQTYSLQHSIFYEFKSFKPEEIIKYRITEPYKYLCWGIDQKKLLEEKFDVKSEILLVAGNPTYNKLFDKEVKQTFSYGLVLLSRFYYHEENIQLIKELTRLSKSTGIRFDVRPHPSLKEHDIKSRYFEYQNLCKNAEFDLLDDFSITLDKIFLEGKYDFTISYNTAAYFDSLINGLISFRFTFNLNDDLDAMDDKFLTSDDLCKKMEEYRRMDQVELHNIIKNITERIGGTGIDNYSTYLD